MDRKTIITKLNRVFCEAGRENKRYSLVWLEDANFGGLYYSKLFILHVQAQHPIEDSFTEIEYVFRLLDKRAKEELKDIWRVSVHKQHEEIDCDTRYIVCEEEEACS